jgi:hypothetical protein
MYSCLVAASLVVEGLAVVGLAVEGLVAVDLVVEGLVVVGLAAASLYLAYQAVQVAAMICQVVADPVAPELIEQQVIGDEAVAQRLILLVVGSSLAPYLCGVVAGLLLISPAGPMLVGASTAKL